MFFLFIFISSIIFLAIALITSRIGIDVENLIINTENQKGQKINKDSGIYIYLLIFRKIKLFRKNIKDIKIPNSLKIHNKDIDIKILKSKDFKINYLELIKNIDIDIIKIDLYVQIGLQDAGLTAILTGLLSAILGIIIRKPKYVICPIYSNKNLLKIKLNGIFSVYLMQYIYKLIFNKLKFEKEKKHFAFQIENGGRK